MARPLAYAAALLLMLLATLATNHTPVAQASELAPADAGTVASLAGMSGDQAASLLAGTDTLNYVCQTFSPYSGCGPIYPSYAYPYYGYNSYYNWYSPYTSYPYSYYGYGYYPNWYASYYPYWGGYWPY
jgi:hypothetical protein